MNRRSIVWSLVALFVLLAAAGLTAGGQAQPTAAAEKVPLKFFSWRVEDEAVYNALIDMYEKKHPNIDVTYSSVKATEWNTALSAAMSGGTGPDIVHVRAYGGLEQYAAPGYLLPLEDKVPALKNFNKQYLLGATARKDGKLYGVPMGSQTLLIYYNKKMYKELGLSEPEAWDDFLGNLNKMKAAKIIPLSQAGKDAWKLEVSHGVICSNFYGANTFFDEVVAGKTNFTDERYRKSLDKLLELAPYMPDGFMSLSDDDSQMLFINELAGHIIHVSSQIYFFQKQNPNLDFGFFPGPAAAKGMTRYIPTYLDANYAVNAASKHVPETVDFINYTATLEWGQYYTDNLNVLSAVPGVVPKSELLKRVLELNKNATPYIMLVGFRWDQPTGSALLQATLQGMMSGKLTSKQVVDEVHAGLVKWYKPFQK